VSKVSILIPTYNRKEYLYETLSSVFAQTYKDFEVVVLDDGSTDGTEQMIKEGGYDVRYYRQENQGEPSARNRLIELARGEYISFLDSDDLLFEDSIERLVKAEEAESDDVIVYGSYVRIDGKGEFYGGCKRKLYGGYITNYLFRDIFVHPVGTLFPKKVFDDIGKFDRSIMGGDYDFDLRASLKYRFVALPEPTFKRRRHSGNISRPSFRSCKEQLSVMERFYYDKGGKEVIPPRMAMKSLAKESYRTGRCALEEGMYDKACEYFRQSFRRHPNVKSLFWWGMAVSQMKTSKRRHL